MADVIRRTVLRMAMHLSYTQDRAVNSEKHRNALYVYKSLFTIQYGRNDNEKQKQKTFTANYYTL